MGINYCYRCLEPMEDGQWICPHCGHDNRQRKNDEGLLPEGTILNGKYLVGMVLGRGGFGVTYLGLELTLKIKTAIKEYFPTGICSRPTNTRTVKISNIPANSEGFERGKEAFQKEAETLAMFSSPSIAHVREFFLENNTAYIVMDYVEGIELGFEIRRCGGRMPWRRVVDLMLPLMTEMGRLHRKNLVHRDIKPANIKIVRDADTGEEHLVLLDFGAARSYTSSNVTKTYTQILTPGFAPFEQYQARTHLGPYTDIYALCATIYAAITGEKPPAAPDRITGEDQPKPFSSYGLDVPEYVEKAVFHGMAVDYRSRPQTMEELYREFLGEAPAAADTTALHQVPDASASVDRRRDDHPAAGSYGDSRQGELSPAGNTAAEKSGAKQWVPETTEKDSSRKRKKPGAWIRILLIVLIGIAAGYFFAVRPKISDVNLTKTLLIPEDVSAPVQTEDVFSTADQTVPGPESTSSFMITTVPTEQPASGLDITYTALAEDRLAVEQTRAVLDILQTAAELEQEKTALALEQNRIAETYAAQTEAAGPTDTPTFVPSPTNTATVTNTPVTPSPIATFTATLTPTITPTRTLIPTMTPTNTKVVTPTPVYGIVSVRGDTGVFVRSTPGVGGDVLRGIFNNSILEILGETAFVDGITWISVRTNEGKEGWVINDVLRTATPGPVEEPGSSIPEEVPSASMKVGDTFTFGLYQQDGASGADPVEWQVLAVEDGRALVISRYGLEAKAYNDGSADITWEMCTLRSWLNEGFYDSAFNSEEKSRILEVTNSNPENAKFGIEGGNDTQDKIFLLSIDEADDYFADDAARMCQPTGYAESGAYVTNNGNGWWWLRSPGYASGYAAFVNSYGDVYHLGSIDTKASVMVRPAFWLDLSGDPEPETGDHEVIVTIRGRQGTAAYDGKAHSVMGYDVEFSDPLYTESDFTYTSPYEAVRTDVGTTFMGLAEDQFRNNNPNFPNVTFVVIDGSMTIFDAAAVSSNQDLKTGDTFTFGSYEQDEPPGADPIEWQVLAVEDGRALLISRYGLEVKAYHEEKTSVTWETCTLRKWLNEDFYDNAFPENEKMRIAEVTNSNPNNPKKGTAGGNDTKDRIFLLSIDEADKYYFSDDTARECRAAYYAEQNGARAFSNGNSWWWLRSPGYISGNASVVNNFGVVYFDGSIVTDTTIVVRPAFWMDL